MLIAAIPTGTITDNVRVLLSLVGLMWLLWVVNEVTDDSLNKSLGIRPRDNKGLRGILCAPLLHGDFSHISGNSLVFIVLGWMTMLGDPQDFFIVTAIAWFTSGFGIWLFGGEKTNHIGASGVVFGYFGFLLLRGYFERSAGAILLAVLVMLLYGNLIWNLLPIREKMSWEGHLFGFLGGVLVAQNLAVFRDWFETMF